MFRLTVEWYDENGRVVKVEHRYQESGELAVDFITTALGWSVKWDIENDKQKRDEDDAPKGMSVYLEQIDHKGHRVNHVQVY